MKKIFLFSSVLSLLIYSCKTTKPTSAVAVPVVDTITDLSFKKVIKDKELYLSTTETIAFDTVYVSKDTLHLLTKNIQACDADNFKLIGNGMYMKSLPPQTNVKLFQLNDVECKEKHQFHLSYNIAPLQMKRDSSFTKGDSIVEKAVLIHLGNWARTLKYVYSK